jgi:hypothetical protein
LEGDVDKTVKEKVFKKRLILQKFYQREKDNYCKIRGYGA